MLIKSLLANDQRKDSSHLQSFASDAVTTFSLTKGPLCPEGSLRKGTFVEMLSITNLFELSYLPVPLGTFNRLLQKLPEKHFCEPAVVNT